MLLSQKKAVIAVPKLPFIPSVSVLITPEQTPIKEIQPLNVPISNSPGKETSLINSIHIPTETQKIDPPLQIPTEKLVSTAVGEINKQPVIVPVRKPTERNNSEKGDTNEELYDSDAIASSELLHTN